MKAQDIELVFTKQPDSDNLYYGYLFYKKAALQSLVAEKIKYKDKRTGDDKSFINLFLEGKTLEYEEYTDKNGEVKQIPKADIQLWVTIFEAGSVKINGDFISDFGLFYQVESFYSASKGSFTLRPRKYKEGNTYDDKAQADFIKKYAEIITDIPEIEFSDEDLARSVELFPDAPAFYEQYASSESKPVADFINEKAPRLMPSAAKNPAKTKITQGQLNQERPF